LETVVRLCSVQRIANLAHLIIYLRAIESLTYSQWVLDTTAKETVILEYFYSKGLTRLLNVTGMSCDAPLCVM